MATNAKSVVTPAKRRQTSRVRSDGSHVGFLSYARYAWLKASFVLCLVVGGAYWMIDVEPRHNGGSWYGYLIGTVSVVIILWLSVLGIRKRAMTRGAWSLKAWTSAHVYLGLSLIVIGTLHTGFQLGYNVHTLAYVLMMVVVISGIFGVFAYATLPRALSNNREEMTETQMLEGLRSIDRQLHDTAQPIGQTDAQAVRKSLDADPFAGGLMARLTGFYPQCATARAHIHFSSHNQRTSDVNEKLAVLLERKRDMLRRVRKHLQLKALLEIWLYVHVPVTFALIAALVAHIVSVFFYW